MGTSDMWNRYEDRSGHLPRRQTVAGSNGQQASMCPFFQRCQDAFFRLAFASADYQQYHLLLSRLSPEHDRCFCDRCCGARGDHDIYMRGGQGYILPKGFARLGLSINDSRETLTNWHVCYHGTTAQHVPAILRAARLASQGVETIRPGHRDSGSWRTNQYTQQREYFDPTRHVFFTPSFRYSAGFMDSWDSGQGTFKFGFQVRIRPASYSIGQENVGATERSVLIDEYVPNNQLEWYTSQDGGDHRLTGLLIRAV